MSTSNLLKGGQSAPGRGTVPQQNLPRHAFRTVAFNDNAAGHGWTLPVPTPRPDFDKPVPAESSLTTVTVVLRITTASPTGDEECQHCHGQHADREPLTSFKVEAEDHSGERTGNKPDPMVSSNPRNFLHPVCASPHRCSRSSSD